MAASQKSDKDSPVKTTTLTTNQQNAAFMQYMLSRPGWCKELDKMGTACSLLRNQFSLDPVEDPTWGKAEFVCELTDGERAVIRTCIRHFISEGVIGPSAGLSDLFYELSILKD